VRVEHILRVVGPQFIDAAELNELLVNAIKKKEEKRKEKANKTGGYNEGACAALCVCWIVCVLSAELRTSDF